MQQRMPRRTHGRTRVGDAQEGGGRERRHGERVGDAGVRDARAERGRQDPGDVAADAVHREARDRAQDHCTQRSNCRRRRVLVYYVLFVL